jgi:hypothetical protein
MRVGKIYKGLALTGAAAVLAGYAWKSTEYSSTPNPRPSADVSKAIGGSCLIGYEPRDYSQTDERRSIAYLPIVQTPKDGTSAVVISLVNGEPRRDFPPQLAGDVVNVTNIPIKYSITGVELQFTGKVTGDNLPAIQTNAEHGVYTQLGSLARACEAIDPGTN